jgi:hypothetical protein
MDTGPGEGDWLTYDQIAKLRGTAKVGAIRWVQRHRLRRQPGNDGLVRILVTPDVLAQTSPPRRSTPTVTPNGAAAFETALAAIREAHAGELTTLRDQLQDQRGRVERAEVTIATQTSLIGAAETRAELAEAEARDVQNKLAEMRQADDARKALGRWARLRAAWRGE